MKRAAVIIGVNKVNGLPTLAAASRSAVRMVEWANSQNIDFQLITDAHGPVTAPQIRKAIKNYVDDGTYEQLIIYFVGHGVNIRFNEYWLLSDAPEDTQAAVNVTGSATLARYSTIPHVVFISDACRTAAETVRAQFVSGSEIFPNIADGGLEKTVDQFYACTLGRPAYEARDAKSAASAFSAVYTQSLVSALNGEMIDALDWPAGEAGVGYVRLRQLKKVLISTVPDELTKLGLPPNLFQIPDARISSDEQAWLSRLMLSKEKAILNASQPRRDTRSPHTQGAPTISLQSVLGKLFQTALRDRPGLPDALAEARQAGRGEVNRVLDEIECLLQGFGPAEIDTGCGFKVRGSSIVEAYASAQEQPQLLSPEVVRVSAAPSDASILLVFANGRGTLLPILPNYLGYLTFDVDGDLIDVAYEPARASARWPGFAPHAEGLRLLRAVAAAGSNTGMFRIDPRDWYEVIRQVDAAGWIDPGLALYAAYGVEGRLQRGRVRRLNSSMQGDHGRTFLDLAILSDKLGDIEAWGRTGTQPVVVPAFPLRAPGWALLSALKFDLAEPLQHLRNAVSNSPWTLFDPIGVSMLRNFIGTGELR